MGAAGFVYGGLTGEGVWDGNKANAFGLSGLMVGAGVGLMLSGGGFLGTVTSSTLVGAGMGGYGTFQYDQTVDWRQWGTATFIGAATGAVSGTVGYGVGSAMGAMRFGPLTTNVVTGMVGGVASSATSQGLTYQLLPETRKDFTWNRFFANMGGAAVGGALGGTISTGLTRGLMHQTGPNAGALRCDVGAMDFFSRHFVGGAVGGFVGDAIDQQIALTWGTKAEKERGWDWSRSLTATVMGGVTGAAGARAAWMMRACFAAGTPIRTPEGWTSIEALQPGDLVLSRDENDPQGRIEAKVVEETFQRLGRVWLLRLEGGVTIRTTPEHPFFPRRAMMWTPAAELRVGDTQRVATGNFRVEAIEDTGVYETVYNCRVADWHTYFVGCDERGVSVWAHNSYQQFLDEFHGGQHSDAAWAFYQSAVREMSRLRGTGANPKSISQSFRRWWEGMESAPQVDVSTRAGQRRRTAVNEMFASDAAELQRRPNMLDAPELPQGKGTRTIPTAVDGLSVDEVAHLNRPGYRNYRLVNSEDKGYYNGLIGPNESEAGLLRRHANNVGPDGRPRYDRTAGDRPVIEPEVRLYGEARLLEHRRIIQDGTNIGEVAVAGTTRGNNQGGIDPQHLAMYLAWERALNGQ